ncbi:phage major capsid protein [Pisciglobus halotolerans]|uniref:Phage major capsid protein, HK97 family n=1 Tax=Pisciglobus halotolerans TaxID=745365 RepID=A0A1I3C2W9_9LACT|nr:phage major capsid protein [Pisciglobus halotolerans]SFH68666.1 phage major capsid protein, HK97 family [Pisciglobus halotolerans]
MKNFDFVKNTLATQRQAVVDALKTDDADAQSKAFNDLFAGIQEATMEEAKAYMDKFGNDYNDERVLSERGLQRTLTSNEKKYFNAVVEKQTFEGIEEVFPVTIVADVFKNLTTEHPLLSRVDAVATGALMKYVYADPTKATAFWGRVPDDIKQILLGAFKSINLETSKLSGYIALPKGFFELGPNWLAQYVVTTLQEIMQATLEVAIVDGNGKEQPIGMTRKLSGSVDGVYPAKDKIEVTDFSATTLAGIHAALAKAKTDNGRVAMLVNPQTYWSKVFPKLSFQDQNGNWVVTGLVTGDEIIESHAVPENTAIFGVPENYFLGVAGDVRVTRYDQTLAIEDYDLFVAKFFGNGVAKNENAFFVADLAEMDGATIPDLEGKADVKKTNNLGVPTTEPEPETEELP